MKGRLKSVDIKKDMITPMKFQKVIRNHLRAVDMMKNYCSPTTKQQDHVFPLKIKIYGGVTVLNLGSVI